MNQDLIKLIGIKDASRKDAYLSYLLEAEGLKDIFDMSFEKWSNFDSWESLECQQWIFTRALDAYKGNKIDIKCNCCEYINSSPSDFDNIKKEKCNGKKSVYMIHNVVEEIFLAKKKRESDGTYSA